MPSPCITLTTDFGTTSPYVAAMKGVIFTRCPQASILDLSHTIPAQDVFHAACFLRDALPWFPEQTIHVVIVDPGVGTSRLPLLVQWQGQTLFCPDNGLWTLLPDAHRSAVFELNARPYWNHPVSNTFHGRDIFAPCAAALANGVKPEHLGRQIQAWHKLNLPPVCHEDQAMIGEVVMIDDFGNLITSIPAHLIQNRVASIELRNTTIHTWASTYGSCQPGELIGLASSSGFVEIALVQGNAASLLQAERRCPVTIRLQNDPLLPYNTRTE